MSKRLWINILIALIATLCLNEIPSVSALSPASTNDAQTVMPANTLEACNANDAAELDEYGRAKIATGPFSWCFLRAIAAVAPARSWTEQQINNGVKISEALNDTFINNRDIPEIMKYMTWGVMSISTGIVWFLVLIVFIAPALWCLCYRRCCFTDADLRGRTGRLCNTITFWICWALAFLFVFGSIYWSSWMRPDFHAAFCLPMKTGEDLYLNGVVKDGSTFASLSEAEIMVNEFDSIAAQVASNNALDIVSAAQEAIISLWEPATVFSAYLWDDSQAGDLQFATGNLTMNRTHFGVQLYDNRAPSPTLDKTLFDDTDTSSIWGQAKFAQITVNQTTNDFMKDVTTAIGDVRDTVTELQQQFIDMYNQLTDYLTEILDGKEPYDVWPFALLIVLSCLPVIGLVAALLLFLYYKKDVDFATQSNSRWRWWAGFMIFGYSVWGIVLFIYGGVMLGAMYFPSDICRAIDKTLDSSDTNRYQTLLGINNPDPQVINSCIKRDPDTSLWTEVMDETGWSQVDQAISNSTTTVNGGVGAWLSSGVQQKVQQLEPHPFIIPINTTTTTVAGIDKTWFCTGLEYDWDEAQFPDDVANDLAIDFPDCFTTLDRFDTIANLTNRLNELSLDPTSCHFCIWPYCSDERSELNIDISAFQAFPTFNDYLATSGWQSKDEILTGFLGDPNDPPNPVAASLRTQIDRCGVNDVTNTTFNEWWWRFYVLAQRAAVLYTGWTTTNNNHDLGWTGNYPLFTRLINSDNPFDGTERVEYRDWKQSYVEDFQAIVAAHNPNMADQLATEIVYESPLGQVRTQYDNVVSSYDCRAVSLTIEEIKDSVCDSFFGDVASVATLAVWLAVLHLIAFIVLMIWWVARRRHRDKNKVKEVSDAEESAHSNNNTPETQASPVVRQGITEAQFFYACEHGDTETARKAAEQYPANSVVDLNYNNTPLHLAAYYGHADITYDLCERGWDPNAFNFKRHTPFTACVSNLYLDTDVKIKVMTILKDHGAWVDVYTGEGDTPLMIATRGNERQIVALLLEWDANPLNRDGEYHWSTLKLAQSANNYEVLEMLREASPRHEKRLINN